jgi:hypothetical protein
MKRVFYLAVALVLLSSLGLAWFRASANYGVAPDAVTEGGGRAASASHTAVQQAAGQTAGFSASASFGNRAGVVQPTTTVPPSQVPDWREY